MGSFMLETLWRSQVDAVDDAREIGATPNQQRVSAMYVGRSDEHGGQLVYIAEVPMYTVREWRIADYAGGRRHRWNRIEFKIPRGNKYIEPGTTLVVAKHPYSSAWVHCAPFKPPCKKGPEERPDPSRMGLGSPSELLYWLDQIDPAVATKHQSTHTRHLDGPTREPAIARPEPLRYDFWEKGAYLTAAISEPDEPAKPIEKVRNEQKKALSVFGVCEDFSASAQALLDTAEVKLLLDQTQKNTIRFWYPRANLQELPKLKDEVIAEGPELMWLSIRQALAGPHEESERWLGRLVVDKVADLYRGHLNARNRVVTGENKLQDSFEE